MASAIPFRIPGRDAPEVLAIRYGTRRTVKSRVYLNFHHYEELDAAVDMDYYFWIVRGGGRTTVVDTGFNAGSGGRRGRTTTCPPAEALARLGVDPKSVDRVVVTHAHYDHAGNLPLFPNAEILIARREFEFWTGPYARREQFAFSAEPEDVAALRAARDEGRLTLVDGEVTVAPGIELIEVGGHTPGQLVVVVAGASGPVVLASDAVHYYEELERDRPFLVVADLAAMYRGFDLVREMTEDSGAALVAGHDPDVLRRFPAVDPADPAFAVRVSG